MKSSKNVTICFIGIIIILIALMPFLIYDHGNASKVINNLNTINSKSSFINLRKHTIDNNYKLLDITNKSSRDKTSSPIESSKPLVVTTTRKIDPRTTTSIMLKSRSSSSIISTTIDQNIKGSFRTTTRELLNPINISPTIKFHDKQQHHRHHKRKRLVVVFTTLFGKKITDNNKLKQIAQINTLQALVNLKSRGLYSIAFVDDPYWKTQAVNMGINRVRPILSKNNYGTPFLHQMLKVARKVKAPLHCYINGDILLGLSFIDTLQMILLKIKENLISKRVYIIGRRYNYNLKQSDRLPDNAEDGEKIMNHFVLQSTLGQPDAFDWFVFSNDVFKWEQVPRFVIGRRAYDNCLTHIAVQDENVVTIDGTMTVRAIHQTDQYGNRANKHFKHKDDLWNEQQCWRQRYLGWIYFCEFETQWNGIEPTRTKYGHVYSPPFPIPKPGSTDVVLIKRERNQHENMVIDLEEKAIERNIATVLPLKNAIVLYTTSKLSFDPHIRRLASKVKLMYIIDVNEKCASKMFINDIRNIKYACINQVKAKNPPPMIWDNKDNAPANSMSPWNLYNQHYERVLQKFGGNFTKYDIAILKGRANPQMAIYLLLFNYFRNNAKARVFLCCMRPYLRNVHYLSVKDYYTHVELLWDSRYGYNVLKVARWEKQDAEKEEKLRKEYFRTYLDKYKLN